MTIRLMQAGGSAVVRRGVSLVLDDVDDIDVVGEVTESGEPLSDAVSELAPDVLLLHLRRVEGSTFEDWLCNVPQDANPSVLLMTLPGGRPEAWQAIRAGVDGCIHEDDAPEELVKAIRSLAAGEAWLPPPFAQELVDHYRRDTVDRHGSSAEVDLLSQRERSVVRLVAMGNSNAEIAVELNLAESTIKTHVSRILRKLGLRDRTQLTRFAHQAGIV
ncbi:response regulator transcription factor [Actinophytocola sp.]|uniref:response regulator transcription factor n=1 Tax=Actinophytocola sp. TaxID=1872138 RepID=UPI002EDAF1B5